MSNPDSVYAPKAIAPELAPDTEADVHVETIEREGFVVLHDVLAPTMAWSRWLHAPERMKGFLANRLRERRKIHIDHRLKQFGA